MGEQHLHLFVLLVLLLLNALLSLQFLLPTLINVLNFFLPLSFLLDVEHRLPLERAFLPLSM